MAAHHDEPPEGGGLDVVVHETFPPGTTDFSAILNKVKAAKPDALVVGAPPPRPVESTPPTAAAPRRGHGPKAQPELPRVEMVHVLDDADQTCPQCGGTLRPMAGQTEDAEEITVVERQFVLVTHKRQKYRCACNGCVDTAPGPLRLAARPDARGARYAPEFAIEVAVGKYLDHLPLERQVRIMRREGLMIDSQTLWDQLATVADVRRPTYDALGQYVLQSPIVGADETWWRLMERPAAKRWWVWSVTREDAVVYRILDTRSQHAAREVLAGYTWHRHGGRLRGLRRLDPGRAGARHHARALLGS